MAANRDITIKVRVRPDEHPILTAAAEHAGMTLSAWVRSVALKEARKGKR